MNRFLLVSALPFLAFTACVDSGVTVDDSSDAVVGGVPAFSRALDAVGSLNKRRASGAFTQSCTGTLITPTVVLTAQHCIEDDEGNAIPPANLVFAVGPDSKAPRRIVPIRALVGELTIDSGGAIDFGTDVAVAHLAQPVTDIPPLRIAAFDERLIGQRFNLLGYGVQSTDEEPTDALFGTRTAGTHTLRGPARGRINELTFGSFEAFVAAAGDFPDLPTDEAELRDQFDNDLLLEDYEAVFGAAPGDAQQCFGDSGGPVLKNVGGKLVVYGVNSAGLASASQVCGGGGIFAVFGPVVIDFLRREAGVTPIAVR
jgi:secreted trypsin-like serine protease